MLQSNPHEIAVSTRTLIRNFCMFDILKQTEEKAFHTQAAALKTNKIKLERNRNLTAFMN